MALFILVFFFCASVLLGGGVILAVVMACTESGSANLKKFVESFDEENKKE